MYTPLARAFAIVDLLARAREGLALSAIGVELGLAKSAAHRLLTSLAEEGFVAQDPVSERYRLTLRLPVLGFRLLATLGLTDVVQPILDRLARTSGELVRLGLVDGDDLIWVAWSQGSSDALRYVPDFGRPLVLHTTGSGTAWLASLPDAEAIRIFRKHRDRAEAHTTGRMGRAPAEREFLAKLAKVRRNGYGLNLELADRGINAIAVAVSTAEAGDRHVVGTLSVAGPSIRLSEKRLAALLPLLKAHAAELGEVWPMHLQITAAR